jgi:hypothetical protein
VKKAGFGSCHPQRGGKERIMPATTIMTIITTVIPMNMATTITLTNTITTIHTITDITIMGREALP